ncbi:MAG: hypothetical protein GC190_19205 [Alphaproteobacteria bacterium]|nr:hypothetical protein [Alphaproteobacteria bacterium]
MTQTTSNKRDHLLLVDASGYAFRSFHAAPAVYRESDGMPVGAVLGFMSMVWRLLGDAREDAPSHTAAIFDAPGKNFRHKIFPDYKANRPAARDEEMEVQWPILRHAAETLGLTPVEMSGYEADDLIATLATRARKVGMRTTIVSSDKDFGQLVEDDHIEIVDPIANVRILSHDIQKRWGVPPNKVAEVQALCGDAVDNIPGIPNLGPTRAAALIRRFGGAAEVVENWQACRWASVRTALKRDGKNVSTYLKLTTLKRDVRLKIGFDALKAQPVYRNHLEEILKVLEAQRFGASLFGLQPSGPDIVDAIKNPFEWWRSELKLRGQSLPSIPQCGFYQRRLVRGGPFVPARIWREPILGENGRTTGKDRIRCEVNGVEKDAQTEWGWLFQQPISEAEFKFQVADFSHAEKYRPTDPKAHPHKPIKLEDAPIPTNPRQRRSS